MASWKKLIFSGSHAEVENLNISTDPTDDSVPYSLRVEDGKVVFSSVPSMPDPSLPEGSVIKSNPGNWLYVVNPSDEILGCTNPYATNYDANANTDNGSCTFINIALPENPTSANMDPDGDGTVATSDLLLFLSGFGANYTQGPTWQSHLDFNGDGTVATADLLMLLSGFGSLAASEDSRPTINWDNIPWQAEDEDYATSASVNAYYQGLADPDSFWTTLPSFGLSYDSTTPDLKRNVKAYIEQTGDHTASIELFTYLYFTQHAGPETDLIPGYSITGGNTQFTRTQISGSYP